MADPNTTFHCQCGMSGNHPSKAVAATAARRTAARIGRGHFKAEACPYFQGRWHVVPVTPRRMFYSKRRPA